MIPSALRDAFRKKTDLKYGTEKETIARRTAASRVMRNPGVAGRMIPMQKEREASLKACRWWNRNKK